MTLRLGATLLLFALPVAAQENAIRLESVTWHGDGCLLTWEVTEGPVDGHSNYKASSRKTYKIDLHNATMSHDGEVRGFSKTEAAQVHRLVIEILGRYAIDSTAWWQDGRGERLSDRARSAMPAQQQAGNKSSGTEKITGRSRLGIRKHPSE